MLRVRATGRPRPPARSHASIDANVALGGTVDRDWVVRSHPRCTQRRWRRSPKGGVQLPSIPRSARRGGSARAGMAPSPFVGEDQPVGIVGVAGDAAAALMVQAVVAGTETHQVGGVGGPSVLPVHEWCTCSRRRASHHGTRQPRSRSSTAMRVRSGTMRRARPTLVATAAAVDHGPDPAVTAQVAAQARRAGPGPGAGARPLRRRRCTSTVWRVGVGPGRGSGPSERSASSHQGVGPGQLQA